MENPDLNNFSSNFSVAGNTRRLYGLVRDMLPLIWLISANISLFPCQIRNSRKPSSPRRFLQCVFAFLSFDAIVLIHPTSVGALLHCWAAISRTRQAFTSS
jgi:hypothetical protein